MEIAITPEFISWIIEFTELTGKSYYAHRDEIFFRAWVKLQDEGYCSLELRDNDVMAIIPTFGSFMCEIGESTDSRAATEICLKWLHYHREEWQ